MLLHQVRIIASIDIFHKSKTKKSVINKEINIDVPASTTTQGVTNLRIKTVSKQTTNQSTVRPTEQTSIGGISVGSNNAG